LQIVHSCTCENGCPSCVHSPKCGSGNKPIDKNSCLKLISTIIKQGDSETREVKHSAAAIIGGSDNPPEKPTIAVELQEHDTVSGCEVLPEHFGVFDLETKYSAAEVGGWHRAEKMGISVGVVYDSMLEGCVTYLEHEVPQLVEHLKKLELIVGFNNRRFDNRVLSAYTTSELSRLPTLDLLEQVSNRLGYRLSLNALAESTLGVQKSGDGLQALHWYQQGNFEKLSKYCQKDVEITKDLLMYGLEQGYLLFRNKAKKTVRLPLQLGKAITAELAKA
jgi:DEAD/DEAH box helicase domain-containing protein